MFLILFIYSKFSNLNVKTSGSNQVSPEIWSEQCSTGFFSYRTVLIWSLLFLFFFFPNHKKQNCGLHLMISSSPIAFPFSHVSSPVGGVGVCVCVCAPSFHCPCIPKNIYAFGRARLVHSKMSSSSSWTFSILTS